MSAPRKKKAAEFMEVAREEKWFQTREKQTENSKALGVRWGGGGRCKELGRGQEVTLLSLLAESGYSVNILINMQLFPWVFFLFFLEK